MKLNASGHFFFKQQNQKTIIPSYKIQKENQLHMRNFQLIHEDLIRAAIKTNKEAEGIQGIKQNNYPELHGNMILKIDDVRTMSLRYVKIPTFSWENKIQYHLVAFCSLDHYTPDDFGLIRALCLQGTQGKLTPIEGTKGPNYTIFLSGKLRGKNTFLQLNTLLHEHHIYMVNTITKHQRIRQPSEVRSHVFKTLMTLFEARCRGIILKINSKTFYYHGEQRHNNIYGKLRQEHDMLTRLKERFLNTYRCYNRLWKVNRQHLEQTPVISINRNHPSEINQKRAVEQFLKLQRGVDDAINHRNPALGGVI